MSVSVLIASEFVIEPSLEARWMADLPPARRAEIGRWPDERDRHRSLLGSRLLVAGLADLGYRAGALATLRYPPQSRPTLDWPVDFSVSHGDGRIVCAVSTHGAVGIDVERAGRVVAKDFHLYLNATERAWAGRSARRFYAVWTRKEAVVKAAGSGGLRDIARVDTTTAADVCELDGRLWRIRGVPVGRSHVAHLALSEEAGDVTFRRVSRQALERDSPPAGRTASAMKIRAVL
jgi:4'-phosphopantetheinyl transferase